LQKFYRINGGATQLKGVVPDIVLPDRMDYLKYREKDNPSALPWDEIAKADYTPWTSTISNSSVVSSSYDQLKTNTTFSKLKDDIKWLDSYSNRDYSLNIAKYRKDQQDLKATYKDMDSLYKLAKVMDVTNIPVDLKVINAAADKTEKNTQWLKRVSNDIYIDETVKVMNKMITQGETAKAVN
jgi:carboxyl-terminal processing protease